MGAEFGDAWGTPFGDAWGAPFGDTLDTFFAKPGNRSASVGAEFGDAWGTPFGDAWGAPFGDTLDTFFATARESAPGRWGPSLVMHGAPHLGCLGLEFGMLWTPFSRSPSSRSVGGVW